MASLRVAAQSFTYIAVYSTCFPSSLSFLYSCSCCCCMSERLVISENPPMCACQRVVVSEYRGQTYHHPPKSIPPPLLHLHTRILVTPSLLIMVGVLIWQRRLRCKPRITKQVLSWQSVRSIFKLVNVSRLCWTSKYFWSKNSEKPPKDRAIMILHFIADWEPNDKVSLR